MGITKKGWNEQLALSLFLKEATYDAGVTINSSNACLMKGHETTVEFADTVVHDKDQVTGLEFGNDQEVIQKGITITYKEPQCRPNSLAGLGNLVLGARTTAQDAALTAYRHKLTPVAVGTALPSIAGEWQKGGIQYNLRGIKGNSLKLSGEAGGYAAMECEMMGSGTRSTSVTAMPATITEAWLRLTQCKVWMEDGSNISITAGTLAQDAEDISSATPDDLKARMKSFEWSFMNNLEPQPGFGGNGVNQDIDYGRRTCELKFSMLFHGTPASAQAEIDHFINQNPLAIEFDLKGGSAPIAATGAFYYGFQLIVPRFKLRKAPLPMGGPSDTLTVEFDCEVFDDGTNPASILEVFTAKAAYLA